MNKSTVYIILSLFILTSCTKRLHKSPLNRKPTPSTIYNAPKPSAPEKYVYKYSKLAIQKMREFGIPASITLAQGILESASGNSYLARKGNNHFGIKVNNQWNGQYIIRKDDLRKDKFRKYKCVEECFKDHSLFLKRPRYSSLFKLEPTDYKAWARGLQKMGYATSTTYAQKLINIIEKYKLYKYDKVALEGPQVLRINK